MAAVAVPGLGSATTSPDKATGRANTSHLLVGDQKKGDIDDIGGHADGAELLQLCVEEVGQLNTAEHGHARSHKLETNNGIDVHCITRETGVRSQRMPPCPVLARCSHLPYQ